jgi:hypothetical protein
MLLPVDTSVTTDSTASMTVISAAAASITIVNTTTISANATISGH